MKKAAAVLAVMVLSGCNSGTYDKAMEQGKLALADGEFDKAQASFELALDEKPKDGEAKRLYENVSDYNEVKKDIEEADWEDALTKAKSLLKEEDLAANMKEALEEYVKTASDNEKQSDAVAKKLEEIQQTIGAGDYGDAQKSINELKQDQEMEAVLARFSEEVNKIETSINERIQQQKAAETLAEKERELAASSVSKKDKYLQKLYTIETEVTDLYYASENGTTAEMKEAAAAMYKKWDDALNEIYGVLKVQLSSGEMSQLREKQRQWIKYRDRTAKAESEAYAGGSFETVQYVRTQADLTRERCYELINIYMQ
ncbi:lysozyme inhibitor LprI family protein [Bacillus badius]|uniref:lysozyme inhibitor LprI family protein n=1 Tax=Bacillus badius TaxID=1455 RepID=UPI0005ADEA74|nr:lysozyme inhibitor LprI family protein [Bacillus badius]KIL76436.1 hypothetical protein SD78_0538 [Bacillus badius]